MMKTAQEKLVEIQNIIVDEFSTPCSITAHPETSLDEILSLMSENSVRHVPVVENGEPIGIVTDRDIRNVPVGSQITAKEAMSTSLYIVSSKSLLRDVVFEMSSRKIGSALVKDEDNSLLIFTSIDALNALNEILGGGNF